MLQRLKHRPKADAARNGKQPPRPKRLARLRSPRPKGGSMGTPLQPPGTPGSLG